MIGTVNYVALCVLPRNLIVLNVVVHALLALVHRSDKEWRTHDGREIGIVQIVLICVLPRKNHAHDVIRNDPKML